MNYVYGFVIGLAIAATISPRVRSLWGRLFAVVCGRNDSDPKPDEYWEL